jgi:endonuclease/exonuclease/phosphatase family metal-dependent hydrolase
MSPPTDNSTSPGTNPSSTRRRRRGALAIGMVLALAIVIHGADRRAALPTSGHIPAPLAARSGRGWPLRLATFNIHGGRDMAGVSSLDGIETTLAGFDLVGLNEVRATGFVALSNQATVLAERGGTSAAFAPSEIRWWCPRFGNALLSGLPVRRWQSTSLPNTRGMAYRNLIVAEVEVDGAAVHVLITHLDNYDDHESQLRQVVDTFLALRTPSVLMGDLNASEDDPLMQELLDTDGVVDAIATAGVTADRRRIDWILLRGLDVAEAGIRDLGASDHPCVWAEVVLPTGASSAATVADVTPADVSAADVTVAAVTVAAVTVAELEPHTARPTQ